MGLECKHFNKLKKIKKKTFKVASADLGLCRQDPQKINFFWKIANADPVRYRTRLQSCPYTPCALMQVFFLIF
jgi:hypothetical protein